MWRKSAVVLSLLLVSGSLMASETFRLPFQWTSLTALRWDASRQQGVVTGGGQYVGFRSRDGLLRSLTGGAAPGASDVSLDPVSGDYFVSASDEGTLKFVSGRDFSLTFSLPAAAPKPTLSFFHPMLKKVGSFNGPGTLSLFDVETTAYEGLILLSDVPKTVSLAPDGRIVALLPTRHELVLLSYRPFRILMRFPLPESCVSPEDLTLDSIHARFWLACGTAGVFFGDYPSLTWTRDPDVPSARQIFWDGERHALVLVSTAMELLIQKGGEGDPRKLYTFPENTRVDWDLRFHRPVSATLTPAGIDLTLHTDLTLE